MLRNDNAVVPKAEKKMLTVLPFPLDTLYLFVEG